jgi:hypothetical protein
MRKLAVFLPVLFLSGALFAQKETAVKTHEIGIFIGCSYYIGDLNPSGHFGPETQPAGGAIYRYNFNRRFSVKSSLLFGNIQGDDSKTNSSSQNERNLSFKSYIRELSVEGEFNFLEYKTGSTKYPFSPYLFAGIAGFMFDPMAQLGNNWVELQPLGTEGQGAPGGAKKYKLTQISIPFGIGMKFSMAKQVCISLEWGMRKTFTPYLDDVSGTYVSPAVLAHNGPNSAVLANRSLGKDPGGDMVGSERGNGGLNDWYSFAGVMLSFQLKSRNKPCYAY